MNLGFSLYFSTGVEKNCELIERFSNAGFTQAFTSLHIPEESNSNYIHDIQILFEACKKHKIELMADIGPRTIEKLGLSSIDQLIDTPIRHLRMDYGFTYEEMVRLSSDFHIILNASTISTQDIFELKKLNADLSKFSACHNFYPKPYSAISIERAAKMNRFLKDNGMRVQMFVPGDLEKRGPLYEGLPTIESHRYQDILLSALELKVLCDTDDVFVGDVNVSDKTLAQLSLLTKNTVELYAVLNPNDTRFFNQVHHDRPDSSDYVIRSQESRLYATPGEIIEPDLIKEIKQGDILLSNKHYLRYSGELEIAKRDMPMNPKINVIGCVCDESIPYLKYIDSGMGFILKEKK